MDDAARTGIDAGSFASTAPEAPLAGARDAALRGWRSPLAIAVVALLAIEALTGLWMYLAPFSVAGQLQVLAHTIAGLILVAPFAVYLVRHVRTWGGQRPTAVMVLGYALLVLGAISIATGLVLTWQAAFGRRIGAGWDLVHLVGGVAIAVLLVVHLVLAFARRRPPAVAPWPAFAAAVRRFAVRTAAAVALAMAAIFGAAAWRPARPASLPLPEGYTLPAYSQAFDEYRGSAFAPSYARTADGGLVDPGVLSGSSSCGTSGCHEQILAEWEPSAHRFAAMNPPFQQIQRDFAADREPAETRYCAGCHDPISLFAGAKDIHVQDLSAPGMQEGISCVVCHSISAADERGNADYVLTPPREYLWAQDEGVRKEVSDFLIRAYPRQHLADYDRNILRSPVFCGACHKQFIPEALNRFGLAPAQNQYDEWRQSHWHTDDPATDLTCRDCHMRLVDSTDPGRGEAGDARRAANDGAHRHHGTIATNMLMPEVLELPHWDEQVRLTIEWIRGETVIPEIADVWPEGPVATVDILAPEAAEPGEEVAARVIVANRKAGHNFSTGPLDFIQAWVHFRVVDGRGAVLAEFGALDPRTRDVVDRPGVVHQVGNARDEGTLVLEGMPLDEAGLPLLEHQLWRKAGGKGQRVIFPRYTDNQVFRFVVPDDAEGPITLSAALNFRRYRQDFLNRVVPDMERERGITQRIVTQDAEERSMAIVPRASDASPAGDR